MLLQSMGAETLGLRSRRALSSTTDDQKSKGPAFLAQSGLDQKTTVLLSLP